MAGLTTTLNIANTALSFSQVSMNTISHNIANVNTDGYSRQEVLGGAYFVGGYGNGVKLDVIDRRVDVLLQQRLTQQQSSTGYAAAKSQYMKNLEVIFGTPGADSSLEKVIGAMFEEINNVANYPDATSQRLNFVKRTEFVADTLNTMDQQLTDTARQIDNELDSTLTQVNSALQRIHQFNEQIAQIENTSINGQNANDLRDQRQKDIDYVASVFKVTVTEDQFGRTRMLTESGNRLVDTSYVQFERTPALPGQNFKGIGTRAVQVDGSLSNTVFQLDTNRLTSGKVKGMVDVRDTEIENLRDQLDNLAAGLAAEMNRVHSGGVGVPPPSSLTSAELATPGVDLFTEIGLVPGSSFDVSIVDPLTGSPANTVTVTLPAVGPYSTANLTADINAALTGAGFPATVTASFSGVTNKLTIADATNTFGIVMGNDADDFLGKIQMNPLFESSVNGDPIDAGNIRVLTAISADPQLVAAARMRSADGGLSLHDNQNALALAAVADTNFVFNPAGGLSTQNDTLAGYYITISSNLAVQLQDNTNRQDFADTLQHDLEERKQSFAGVNMDEELANLIVFQNAFQASARVITVVDELMDTLINIIR
ncbi:MAG: flagellar hook-associated protein FlgK [Proteobacteria bacterium]|nr:flagellar hook-associated protein FlgK [Pseudomonadota bacterium]